MKRCRRCNSDDVRTTQAGGEVWRDGVPRPNITVCNVCGEGSEGLLHPLFDHVQGPLQLDRMQDVDAWNAWRAENDGERVRLAGASVHGQRLDHVNLNEADLREADLSEAHLAEADLSGADLSGADLSGADLRFADLSGADLSGAYLDEARLDGTDLSGADLRGTDLSKANFSEIIHVDLSGADLSGANLNKVELMMADLSGANLSRANLSEAKLNGADLRRTDLTETLLYRVVLEGADLSGANLFQANLLRANLDSADLSGVNLSRADLTGASLVKTKLDGADLAAARVYGVSVWDVTGTPSAQTDLIITERGEAEATVDDLKVAQFIYLLLSNAEIRDVIDTVAHKAVLILGRFTPERKSILDTLRVALREKDYVPIMFDFEKPASRGYGETVKILAGMSRFVIADLTDSAEIRSELMQVAPNFPSLPIQPILLSGQPEYVTFETDVRPFTWVLDIVEYRAAEDLVATVERVIEPAEAWLEGAHRSLSPDQELLDLREKVAALERQVSTQQ